MRLIRALAVLVFTALSASCGGGSDTSSPPSGLSYPSPQPLTVGVVMTELRPTVTGTVTAYAVSPALPQGLQINSTSGAISGTPSAVAPSASYTVTATNEDGSASAPVSLQVNAVKPSIQYGSAALTLTTGVPVNLTPTNTGGAVVTWSIAPALPSGVTFNAADGSIGGTPVIAAAAGTYVVSATNSGGTSTFNLTLTVNSGVVLELGHATDIRQLRLTDERALSRDGLGHWVLWNFASGEILASGDNRCTAVVCPDDEIPVELAGDTVVIETPTGLEIRDATDGSVLSQITMSGRPWKLATDGSYITGGSTTALTVWSRAGQVLGTRPGDYSKAKIFAAPAQIRVASGAAGAAVIEYVVPAGGASTVSPAFQGEFHAWFSDGERLLTRLGNTVWTYSKATAQEGLVTLPFVSGLAGTGDWFWIVNSNSVRLFAVGSGATPVATYAALSAPMVSGRTLAVWPSDAKLLKLVDLSGATPVATDINSPVAFLSAYAETGGGHWILGNRTGVVVDGAGIETVPRYLALGAVRSIAGSSTRIAVATSSGSIRYFSAVTLQPEGLIPFSSSQLQISADGTVLVARANSSEAQYSTDRSVKVFSLPSATTLATFPYTYPSTRYPVGIDLSRSGTVLATTFTTKEREVTGVPGTPAYWSDTFVPASGEPPLRLSPDGTRAAYSNIETHSITDPSPPLTNIVHQGTLVSAVPGTLAGWIDDNRLLACTSIPVSMHLEFENCSIYDATGNKLATTSLPSVVTVQAVDANSVYSPSRNAIYSLSTGAAIWTSAVSGPGGLPRHGVVAGDYAVYSFGARVVAEPH